MCIRDSSNAKSLTFLENSFCSVNKYSRSQPKKSHILIADSIVGKMCIRDRGNPAAHDTNDAAEL